MLTVGPAVVGYGFYLILRRHQAAAATPNPTSDSVPGSGTTPAFAVRSTRTVHRDADVGRRQGIPHQIVSLDSCMHSLGAVPHQDAERGPAARAISLVEGRVVSEGRALNQAEPEIDNRHVRVGARGKGRAA